MAKSSGYSETEVSWKLDDFDMYGTLCEPSHGKAKAGVIFVAGSGPTDRDWCSPLLPGANGSGRLLARELAEHGFTSLRFDKRAAGPHARENIPRLVGNISMRSHADEVSSAVHSLAERAQVGSRIFALTSSEGAIHALNYQLQQINPRFSGFVLTGMPGRSISDVTRQQMTFILRGTADPEKYLREYDDAMDKFRKGEKVEVSDDLPEAPKLLIQSLTAEANLPFSRELWLTNPGDLLRQVSEPALVIIGKKDLQVNWQEDGKNLEAIGRDKGNLEIAYPENANHVLKFEQKARVDLIPDEIGKQYNSDRRELDPETAHIVLEWLDAQL